MLTLWDYESRPEGTIKIVKDDFTTEIPYEIINDTHMFFYDVPLNTLLYVVLDTDLVQSNYEVFYYTENMPYAKSEGNLVYMSFTTGSLGGSITVRGSTEE